jgi:hypothetical protein
MHPDPRPRGRIFLGKRLELTRNGWSRSTAGANVLTLDAKKSERRADATGATPPQKRENAIDAPPLWS